MINKKDFWKKVLTTTAVVGTLAGAATEAGAAATRVAAGNTDMDNIGGLAAWVDGTQIEYPNAGGPFTVTATTAAAQNPIVIGAIDAQAAGVLTLAAQDVSLGSVGHTANGGRVAVNMAAGRTLTLTGTAGAAPMAAIGADVYDNLGVIDFKNTVSTVVINSDTTISGGFTSTGGSKGTVQIAAGKNVTFEAAAVNFFGAAAGVALANVSIGNGAVLSIDAKNAVMDGSHTAFNFTGDFDIHGNPLGGAGGLNLDTNGNAILIGNVTAAQAGVGAINVDGDQAVTIGNIGTDPAAAGFVINSVTANTGAGARTFGNIFAANAVKIGQVAANAGDIQIGNITTTTANGAVTLKNKQGNLVVGNINAGGAVTINTAGNTALTLGNVQAAADKNIAITLGAGGVAGAGIIGTITALGTGTINIDATNVAVAHGFKGAGAIQSASGDITIIAGGGQAATFGTVTATVLGDIALTGSALADTVFGNVSTAQGNVNLTGGVGGGVFTVNGTVTANRVGGAGGTVAAVGAAGGLLSVTGLTKASAVTADATNGAITFANLEANTIEVNNAAHAVTFGAILDRGGDPAAVITIANAGVGGAVFTDDVGGGINFTADGLATFGGAGLVAVSGAITSGIAGNFGTLTTQGVNGVTFAGNIGVGKAINAININTTGVATTFTGTVNTDDAITLGNAATLAVFMNNVTAGLGLTIGNNANSTITFDASNLADNSTLTVTGVVQASNANTGKVVVITAANNKNVTFVNGVGTGGGAKVVDTLAILGAGTAQFSAGVTANTSISVNGGATAIFNRTVTSGAGANAITFLGNGTMRFAPTANMVVNKAITTQAGASRIEIDTTGGTFTSQAIQAGNVVVTASPDNVLIAGGIDGNADVTSGAGAVNLGGVTGDAIIKGAAGANVTTGLIGGTLTLNNATVGAVPDAGTHLIITGNSTITGAAGAINVGGAGQYVDVQGTLNLTAKNALQGIEANFRGAGTLVLKNSNTLNADLASDANPITNLTIGSAAGKGGNYNLTANGQGIYATNIMSDATPSASRAVLNLSAANSFVDGTIGSVANPFEGTVVLGNYDMTGANANQLKTLGINARNVNIAGGAVVESNGRLNVGGLAAFAANTQGIFLGDGSQLTLNLSPVGGKYPGPGDKFSQIAMTAGKAGAQVDFAGGGTVTGNVAVGNGTINFDAAIYNLNGKNLTAANTKAAAGATISLSDGVAAPAYADSTITGNFAGNGTTFDLGQQTLNITGAAVLTNAITIRTATSAVNTAGTLKVVGALNPDNATALAITVNDAVAVVDPVNARARFNVVTTGAPLQTAAGVAYTAADIQALVAAGGGITATTKTLMNWNVDLDAGQNIVLTAQVNVPAAIGVIDAAVAHGLPEELAEELKEDLIAGEGISPEEWQELTNEAILGSYAPEVQDEYYASHNVTIETTGAVIEAASAATAAVSNRVGGVVQSTMMSSVMSGMGAPSMASGPSGSAAVSMPSSHAAPTARGSEAAHSGSAHESHAGAKSESGSAAAGKDHSGSEKSKAKEHKGEGKNSGDVEVQVGAWISGFGSSAIQKQKGLNSGYKANVYGGSVGIDTMLNENLMIGAAFTQADSRINHRDIRKGNTTNVNTSVFSAYGFYNFGNNWFMRAIASYGVSEVKNVEKRAVGALVGGINYANARSKYRSKNGSFDVGGGYVYAIDDSTSVTPTASVQFSHFMDKGYSESGAGVRNLIVKKKQFNQFYGNLGLSLAKTYVTDEDTLFIPEAHASVTQLLGGKKAKIITTDTPTWDRAWSATYKPEKTTWSAGLSGTIKAGMAEFGLGYDATFAKKYLGHQGTVKLRVNF